MRESIFDSSISFKEFLSKTLLVMAVGLTVTTLVAWLFSGLYIQLIYSLGRVGFYMPFILMIVEFILVIYFTRNLMNLSKIAAYICFFVYSILNGCTLSTIFLIYTDASIAMALGTTALMFACMSYIGHSTNIDLSKFSSLFRIGLITMIIVSVINIFIGSSFMTWATSCLGIVIFLGLIAFDTQKLRYLYNQSFSEPELNAKLAIYGAFELYLDFINLFIRVLQIFGRRRD